MKAAMNGVLNLSVVDGWVGEGPQHGVSGWLLDVHHSATDPHEQNLHDLNTLYRVLFDEVIPTYYENPDRWHDMMRASIDMSHYKFSSARMIREYYELMYKRIMERHDAISAAWMTASPTHYEQPQFPN